MIAKIQIEILKSQASLVSLKASIGDNFNFVVFQDNKFTNY